MRNGHKSYYFEPDQRMAIFYVFTELARRNGEPKPQRNRDIFSIVARQFMSNKNYIKLQNAHRMLLKTYVELTLDALMKDQTKFDFMKTEKLAPLLAAIRRKLQYAPFTNSRDNKSAHTSKFRLYRDSLRVKSR